MNTKRSGHPRLSDEEFERRLQMLAEIDQGDFEDLMELVREHRNGRIVAKWIGRKWVLISSIGAGIFGALAFGDEIVALMERIRK